MKKLEILLGVIVVATLSMVFALTNKSQNDVEVAASLETEPPERPDTGTELCYAVEKKEFSV
jgi:hypothetical protein